MVTITSKQTGSSILLYFYMFKIIRGQGPSNFINKFSYISGGSRDINNCNLYTPKSKNLKNFYYSGYIVNNV